MGLGKSMKETTLHHFRDPLVDVVSADNEVALRGVLLVGSPDDNTGKYFVSGRAAMTAKGMDVDGVILSCNGFGNNHIDYANTIEQLELCGIPCAALSLCPANDFVVQNPHLGGILCFSKDKDATQGDIGDKLALNTVTSTDARKALAFLKLRMRKK